MNDMTMGQRIAEQRKKLGLSQEALGEKLGVSRQAISKWESDGAVPEIDKLIGLSKLFSVSVGWLLGVEENTPPRPDELTESQIKMVEEIVKQYQPQPEKRKYPWVAVIAILATALVCIVIVLNPSVPDYSGQIGSLQSNYQSIQSELQSLSGRVEDIATAAEEAEKPLQSHDFRLLGLSTGTHSLDPVSGKNMLASEAQSEELQDDVIEGNSITVDLPTAELTFSAVPKQHTDSDRAWLVVLLEGQPMGQVECVWTGAGYLAEFSLWLVDGYEYRFVVEHGDGTQQIQMLEEFIYNDLAYGTSLHCTVESSVWGYDSQSWTFRIEDCWILAEKPGLGNAADARWTESGLILYLNGEELKRNIMPVEEDSKEDTLLRGYSDSDASLRTVKPTEGDELKLTFYAALDNGMSMEATVGRWTFQSGSLISIPEE